jgi:hypothetical protein
MCTNTVAVTATGSWSIYKWGWQFSGSQALDEAYVPFFGAFGAAWDDSMVLRWSANPLGILWPEMDEAFDPARLRPALRLVAEARVEHLGLFRGRPTGRVSRWEMRSWSTRLAGRRMA